MRIKNGKIKLDPTERRVGNFIIKDEPEHVKVMDINQIFTHRASKRTSVGLFLKQSFDALSDWDVHNGLRNWFAVLFTAFSTIPDMEFLESVMGACKACMERHPEAYGMPPGEGTEEENAQAEAGMKEMMDFENDLKNMPDDV